MKLETLKTKIDDLKGDYSDFKQIIDGNLAILESGRRAGRDFVVKTNMKTLRSGPNKGKVRVNGAVLVMFGKRDRTVVRSTLITKSKNFLDSLDGMVRYLSARGQ